MKQSLFTLPILPGKIAQARAFLRALEGERKDAFAACEARLGVTKEIWAIQTAPQEMLICYFAAADIERVAGEFVASREEFDLWFRTQVAEIAGEGVIESAISEVHADFQA